jgi:anti-sigma factor RsiW
MRCKNVLDRLDDHVDGLLPVAEAADVRDHLDLCRECRETAMAVKAATTSLADWADAAPSDECFQKILARLEALPVEAFERAAAANAAAVRPAGFLDRPRVVLFRRVATGGLAAAATVLGALVVSRTADVRGPRHVRETAAPMSSATFRSAPTVPWMEGAAFDDDLYYPNAVAPMRRRPDVLEFSTK